MSPHGLPGRGCLDVQSLYQEAWWLEAASRGNSRSIEVRWDNVCVARLIFTRTVRLGGFTHLGQPPYTRTLGPVLNLPPASPLRHAMNVRRVISELVARLPPHDRFYQQLDPDQDYAFAFAMSGCQVTQDYTFRIGCGEDPDRVLAGMLPDTRRMIKSAARSLIIEHHHDIERFICLAGRDYPDELSKHDFGAVRRIFAAARERDQAAILAAINANGADVASTILVWGRGVLYYWLSHRDRAIAGGSSNAFLLWEAFRYAGRRYLDFDFDGFNSFGLARFQSRFGRPPVVRAVVTHRSLKGLASDFVSSSLRRYTDGNGRARDPAVRLSFASGRG